MRFWQLDTGAGESFQAHDNTVSALAAYRDQLGSLVLASADFEGAIIIWRAHAKDGLKKDRVRKGRPQSYRFDGTCSPIFLVRLCNTYRTMPRVKMYSNHVSYVIQAPSSVDQPLDLGLLSF